MKKKTNIKHKSNQVANPHNILIQVKIYNQKSKS